MTKKDYQESEGNLKSTYAILAEFYDMAESRCSFSLNCGDHYEGYFLRLEEGKIVFGGGGPMAPEEDMLIPIGDVDLSTLSFWHEGLRCYMDAKWDDTSDRWAFRPSATDGRAWR